MESSNTAANIEEQEISALETGIAKFQSLTRLRSCQKTLLGMLDKVEDDEELTFMTQILGSYVDNAYNKAMTGVVDTIIGSIPGATDTLAAGAGGSGSASGSGEEVQFLGFEATGSKKRQPHPRAPADFVRSDTAGKKGPGRPRKNRVLTAEDAQCINSWKTRHQASRFDWKWVLEENPQLRERYSTPSDLCAAYHSYQQYWSGRVENPN